MHACLRSSITRIIVPCLLALLVALVIWKGGNSLPNWLANAAVRTGLGIENMVKLLIACMLAGGAFAALFARVAPAVAWITLGGVAFVGMAELAALFTAPGSGVLPTMTWLLPLIALVAGAAGLWGLGATSTNAAAAPASSGRITAWRALVALFVVAVSLAVAARLTVHPRDSKMQGGVEFIDLDAASWVGKTVPGTGLPRRLPEVTAYTLEGTKWIVFYQPSCGRCHEVFNAYFAGDQANSVVAIEVPHAPDSHVLPSDQPEDINCENCLRLSLPQGIHWSITTPTIVKVENGVVTCVSSSDYQRCRSADGTSE